jgi:hypothetical protein
LHLHVISPENAHLSVQDVSAAQNVWDSPHPGLNRITIRVNNSAKTPGCLAVIADPSGKEENINSQQLIPVNEW